MVLELLRGRLHLAADKRELIVAREPLPEHLVALAHIGELTAQGAVTIKQERRKTPRLAVGRGGQADELLHKRRRIMEQQTRSEQQLILFPRSNRRIAYHAQALHKPD